MRRALLPLYALLLTLSVGASAQVSPVPTLMNFQGRLARPDGTPVSDGNFSLRFSLHTLASGGTEKWNQTIKPVKVKNGVFTVLLNLGSGFVNGFTSATVFNGDNFLEMKVGADAALTPRQQIVSVGYAFKANTVPDGAIGTAQLANDAVTAAKILAGAVGSSEIADGSIASADIATSAVTSVKILDGTITAADIATGVLNFWRLDGNAGTNSTTNFLGTTDNQAFELRVNNSRALRLQPLSGLLSANVLLGGPGNQITNGAAVATISGGGYDPGGVNRYNKVTDNLGTIGGGSLNIAGNENTDPSDAINATVSGGERNEARGAGAFIGGGYNNTASGTYSVIGGGQNNQTSGGTSLAPGYAVVGGGDSNIASGIAATVPGGRDNSATNTATFAAGNRAKANHGGAFVWADNTAADFTSTGTNQFLVRASGGVGINTNDPLTALHIVGALHLEGTASDISVLNTEVLQVGHRTSAGAFSERMRIATNGFVGINDTSPDYQLDVNGDINASGSVRSNGSALLSDARYKTHIQTFPDALETILQLRGVTFDWDREQWKNRNFPVGKQIGFIAQEIEKVLPELVQKGPDGYRAVAYQNVVPVLVEAVKTLKSDNDLKAAELKAVKAHLTNVTAELEELKAAVRQLQAERANR